MLDPVTDAVRVYLLPLGVRVVLAVLVFLIGRAFARGLIRAFDRAIESSKLDLSVRRFLRDLIYAVMLVAVVIAALDIVGIETTAVIAVLGAAGLAVGLALQGSLSNVAAGVMLILLRPYKVGDLVVLGKYVGRVEVIKVFHTVLITADHREITIPNAKILADPIENLTALGRRRLDFVVTVFDAPDVQSIKELLEGVVRDDPRIATTPAPAIELAEITEAAIKLHLRPWTSVEHYPAVLADTLEQLRVTMTAAGLRFAVGLQG